MARKAAKGIDVAACRPAWLFDDSPIPDPLGRGDRAVRFVKLLKLTEGPLAGQPMAKALSRWQERLIRRIYGDVDANGRRRIRTVAVWLPRGNGKTTLVSALGLLHLFGPEKDAAGQITIAASDREQASIAYNSARRFCEADPRLARIVRTANSVKTIRHPKSESTLKALSSESYTKHGLNVSLLVADEVHSWPAGEGRELWRVLRTSMGKREEPLTWVISTAGRGDQSQAWDLWEYSRKVRDGEIDDPSFLPVIFAAPPDADWRDPELWAAVNPGIADGFINTAVLDGEALEASHLPAEAATFKQLRLNIWQDGAAEPWLEMDAWDKGADPVPLDSLRGAPCWIGVDLAAVEDLTSIAVAWLRPEGGYYVQTYSFMPENTLRRRTSRDGGQWKLWAETDHLTIIPGPAIDYATIEARIRDLCRLYHVQEVAFDPWGAKGIQQNLMAEGVNVVEHRQGFASMTGPCKEFQRAVLAGDMTHGADPILRFCVSNAVADVDPAGNVKLTKKKAREKIDAAVAAVMAVGRAAAADTVPSPYETQRPDGFLVLAL